MSSTKTYVVSFYEKNFYRITLNARSEEEALEKADNFYCDDKMDLFEFDASIGGDDDWQVEEVQP